MTEQEIKERLKPYFDNVRAKKHIVTVFMLTYRRPHYLSLAIKSVLSQTYEDFYFIVLDNVSGDSTKDVVEDFKDERIIYLERSSVQHDLRNYDFAFSICKTKYIVVFHDDDIIHNDYLVKMLDIMEKNNDYCLLSCSYNVIDENGNINNNIQSFKNQSFKGISTYKSNEFLIDCYACRLHKI